MATKTTKFALQMMQVTNRKLRPITYDIHITCECDCVDLDILDKNESGMIYKVKNALSGVILMSNDDSLVSVFSELEANEMFEIILVESIENHFDELLSSIIGIVDEHLSDSSLRRVGTGMYKIY